MSRLAYPTDLSNAQWAIIEPFLPQQKPAGRNIEVTYREVVHEI